METDRRGHTRFLVQDDVLVALPDGFTKIGKAKGIGRGGLSFDHIYENSTVEVPKAHVSPIDDSDSQVPFSTPPFYPDPDYPMYSYILWSIFLDKLLPFLIYTIPKQGLTINIVSKLQ